MFETSPYNDAFVKEVCYNCGSATAKRSYNYFRRVVYLSNMQKGNVWSEVWSKDGRPVAFYFAIRSKDHVRLIEIAVREEFQRRGIARMVLVSLLKRMKAASLYKLTFRTPIEEAAPDFWLHVGANITGLKGDDYEMEITIK